ncbi:MAG: hypothetical protein QNJ81_06620, partial [Acidimicrobiia bacterium]|nr:hypothetical protein [Acidimicrobiia bacterium]
MEAATHRTLRRRVVWLTGLALAATLASAIPPQVEPAVAFGGNCSNSSVGYTPLSDSGDLYAAGNTMPSSHAAAAPDITPQGGVIGVVSLGMSNAAQEWQAFMGMAESSPAVASSLRFGNGSIGGQT